jgi:succinoglycan biosynthesis protein ExoM
MDLQSSAARSGGSIDRLGIDICICTYHRPGIVDTLKAVAAQTGLEEIAIRVVVADNATEPAARESIGAAAKDLGLDLVYVHAPANNISIARNACLALARNDWIAFVDDDECPSPNWLRELILEAQRGGWDAVLGPVHAVYPEATPHWLRMGDFHSIRPVWVRGRIETGYTCNVLIRRALILRAELEFRPEFGRTGGEDLDFFYRFRDAGGRIGFAPNAIVYDPVQVNRTSLIWLLWRHFRQGQSHGTRLRNSAGSWLSAMANLHLALAKAMILGLAAACQPRAMWRNRYLTRAVLHCGVAARLAGITEIKLY